jgi:hypothetical protein
VKSARQLSLTLAGVILAGCFQAPPPPAPPVKAGTPAVGTGGQAAANTGLTANEILAKLLATYRGAATYQDQGTIKLEFSQRGERSGDQQACSVQFVRPNKLALHAFQATVKCNGRDLLAAIEDPLTANLDGQVLARSAPQTLKLADLASDPLLYDLLSSQLRRQPIQLELLLESGGLAAAFGKDIACKKLADGKADGRDCFRVEVPSPGGPFVFWVDQADFLLRRLDYPVAGLMPELASDPSVSDLRLYADLAGAKIGGEIPDAAFALQVPDTAKKVKSFVEPPQPLPTTLLGKETGEFFFTDLSGGKLTATDLSARVAVLAWYHDDPACEATLQQVATARERLKDDDAVNFLAVATDPTSASNDDLKATLVRWKADLPIVRDLEAFGDKTFKIQGHPTVVILDEKGRVQMVWVGGNPQLADQIGQIVARLKMGSDLAAEIVAQHERERKQYDELVARGGPEPGEVIELPEAVIRQRSQPKHLKLTELWSCRELKSPGNFLIVNEQGQPPRVFVLEGWRTITELGDGGKIAKRHTLELPEQAAITFARTTKTAPGQRLFVAAATSSPQLHVFDASWQRLFSYPPEDQAPLAVTDLALADVNDADGQPEVLAANVSEIGLVAVGLDGKPAWRNAALANVFSVAVTPPNDVGTWGILLAGDRGAVLRVNRFGREEPELKFGQWPIVRLLAAGEPGATQAAFLGLSSNPQGQPVAVGITADMKEAWNYPLPAGAHQRPIEPLVWGNLLAGRQGEWWLAGADGSIHVVSEDGELFDSFNYGAALTGLAAARLGDQAVLLVATDEGVTAWKVE